MNRLATTAVFRVKNISKGISTLSKPLRASRNTLQHQPICHAKRSMAMKPSESLHFDGWALIFGIPSTIAIAGSVVMFIKSIMIKEGSADTGKAEKLQKLNTLIAEVKQPATDSRQTVQPAAAEASTATTAPPPEIPEHTQYLIIGAGTASHAAFQAIKARDPKAKVLVIGQENHKPYVRPPLSKQLWFKDNKEQVEKSLDKNYNRSIFYEVDSYYFEPRDLPSQENGGVAVLMGKKVVKLDGDSKTVYLDDGSQITYEKCLISTGGEPRNLPQFEKASKQIQDRTVVFRTIEDYRRLDAATESAKSVVVIGGGFLGSELACALGHKGKTTGMTVNQVFPESGVLGMVLPEALSKYATKKVQNAENVNVMSGKLVKSVDFTDNQVSLTLSDDSQLKADQVVVAVGLEPNTQLAKTAGLEVDPVLGGFLVNSELEARSNIWVLDRHGWSLIDVIDLFLSHIHRLPPPLKLAGDTACFYDKKLGRRRVEHHDHAVVSGRLAGQNMTGAAKPYTHQSMFWSDLGKSVSFEAMGVIDSRLQTHSVFNKDEPAVDGQEAAPEEDNFRKGVVFYLRDNSIVGVLTWNLENKMEVARRVIQDGAVGEDILEVAKLFEMNKKPEVK